MLANFVNANPPDKTKSHTCWKGTRTREYYCLSFLCPWIPPLPGTQSVWNRTRTRSGTYEQVKGHAKEPERRKRPQAGFVCWDMVGKKKTKKKCGPKKMRRPPKNSLLVIFLACSLRSRPRMHHMLILIR
uniref:Uncharacterized protein n=1 Tax=Morchella brunnea TaxID=1174671 RepID=A0A8K1I7M9_9PEZI|nr:hypothetical protein LK370_mgp241 [Morchella brunnea]UBU98423.1 hypothetical protein [Morchella brunnea]